MEILNSTINSKLITIAISHEDRFYDQQELKDVIMSLET